MYETGLPGNPGDFQVWLNMDACPYTALKVTRGHWQSGEIFQCMSGGVAANKRVILQLSSLMKSKTLEAAVAAFDKRKGNKLMLNIKVTHLEANVNTLPKKPTAFFPLLGNQT